MPGWCRETEVYQLIHGWSISCDNKPKERSRKVTTRKAQASRHQRRTGKELKKMRFEGVSRPEPKRDRVQLVAKARVGRIDLTPVALPESVFLILSRRRLWYIGGAIHACKYLRAMVSQYGPF